LGSFLVERGESASPDRPFCRSFVAPRPGESGGAAGADAPGRGAARRRGLQKRAKQGWLPADLGSEGWGGCVGRQPYAACKNNLRTNRAARKQKMRQDIVFE
jgi:hypothetical protein